jgi:hypothetical protein
VGMVAHSNDHSVRKHTKVSHPGDLKSLSASYLILRMPVALLGCFKLA